jgi:HD superfamily phosphohydrolase YqeK
MRDLDKEFKKNELAYLAFTSKIERPIRDKFAWVMHQKLSEYHVTREYGIPGG